MRSTSVLALALFGLVGALPAPKAQDEALKKMMTAHANAHDVKLLDTFGVVGALPKRTDQEKLEKTMNARANVLKKKRELSNAAVKASFDEHLTAASQPTRAAKPFVKKWGKAVSNGVTTTCNAAADVAADVYDVVTDTYKDAVNNIAAIAKHVGNAIQGAWDAVTNLLKGLPTSIRLDLPAVEFGCTFPLTKEDKPSWSPMTGAATMSLLADDGLEDAPVSDADLDDDLEDADDATLLGAFGRRRMRRRMKKAKAKGPKASLGLTITPAINIEDGSYIDFSPFPLYRFGLRLRFDFAFILEGTCENCGTDNDFEIEKGKEVIILEKGVATMEAAIGFSCTISSALSGTMTLAFPMDAYLVMGGAVGMAISALSKDNDAWESKFQAAAPQFDVDATFEISVESEFSVGFNGVLMKFITVSLSGGITGSAGLSISTSGGLSGQLTFGISVDFAAEIEADLDLGLPTWSLCDTDIDFNAILDALLGDLLSFEMNIYSRDLVAQEFSFDEINAYLGLSEEEGISGEDGAFEYAAAYVGARCSNADNDGLSAGEANSLGKSRSERMCRQKCAASMNACCTFKRDGNVNEGACYESYDTTYDEDCNVCHNWDTFFMEGWANGSGCRAQSSGHATSCATDEPVSDVEKAVNKHVKKIKKKFG